MLKPFDPAAICEKCGYDKIFTLYHAAEPRCMLTHCNQHPEKAEHLYRRCERCRFDWREAAIIAGPAYPADEQRAALTATPDAAQEAPER